ncbi:MAG: nucleoside triphosphate pyrophosphohydrolase, partial [Anaerolineales bacterium]|nr:nucleoside triphosphate pyrophosphohydrolase [Anaerolineales bacterium]
LLAEVVATLRGPNGCPWDQEQTPQSMRSGFLEEAYEVLEALDLDDEQSLQEELGDMLLHIVMQVQMASEVESFKLTDVIAGIVEKLIRRHPHIWGDVKVKDSAQVVQNWESIKAQEKGTEFESKSILDNIPNRLPALAQSQKIQERVAKEGFDWQTIDGVYAKLHEEVNELQASRSFAEKQMELGDVLFVVVNLGKWLGIDSESALREANLRFSRRFRKVETLAEESGLVMRQMSEDDLIALWLKAKALLADLESTYQN